MATRVAINGFGRIGRLVLRAIIESRRNDIHVVGINDLGSVKTNAHLLKYDSVHGTLASDVNVNGESMDVGQGPIKVTAERDPKKLPWKELGVDVALECTVVMKPFSMPTVLCSTSTTGTRQLVVQEALETTVWLLFRASWLMP